MSIEFLDLNNFLASPLPIIKDFASRANQIYELHANDQISAAEAKDLLDDLVSLKHIDDAVLSIEIDNELQKLVNLISKINTIKGFI